MSYCRLLSGEGALKSLQKSYKVQVGTTIAKDRQLEEESQKGHIAIRSMYGIFTYIWLDFYGRCKVHIRYMDPMGLFLGKPVENLH